MKYFYCLLLITVSFKLQAQSNFKPGYIVSLNGDTTKGSIDYKQWGHRNPTHITFKDDHGQAAKNYAVDNINAFGIDNAEYYRALTISLSQNMLSIDDLTTNIDSSVITQKVFLRVIVVGERLSLFGYEDSRKARFYVAEGRSTPVELLHYKYLNPANVSQIIDVPTYREHLQRLAAIYQTGNALLSQQIQDLYYDEDDIKKVIVKIDGSTVVKYLQDKRSAVRFFAGIGINATEMHFNGTIYDEYGKKWSYFPEINAGFDFSANKNVERIVFRLEMNLSASKTSFSHISENVEQYQPLYRNDQRFGFTRYALTIYPQVLYYFYRTDKFKAYLGAGLGVQAATYTSQISENYQTLNNKTVLLPGTVSSILVKNYVGFTSRAGFVTNKLQIYFAFDPPVNLKAKLASYQLYLTSYRLGVNYLFGKE